MDEKQKNQKDKPKLGMKDHFRFDCHPGVACFTKCCSDINIFLGPYDVLRLKNRLGISSSEFLDKHTYLLSTQNQIIPVVVLKMSDDENKMCHFVTDEGCQVYEDRPWPCRMYPLDMDEDEKFSVLADPETCFGLQENKETQVIEWLEDQGIMDYQRAYNYFNEIASHPKIKEMDVTNQQIKSMIIMATYNLDKFREFVFGSSFLDIFDLEADFIEQLRVDDTELLRFGLDWIKFGLFGEKTLKIKPEVLEARSKQGLGAGQDIS
ncbi:MAG: YkgJ family cysteine cluster protein [Deltaproteobacteria bacterium]|nr:YkgJ family cysteine cluster protein [Deltaproteobacteria bacterium]MBW2051339.1 YkgJ family cysteine cluster protein [Deltaproteobacteria bacterium]MBW2139714.1 YkgJ family cysteine cluster protein [Deltaproteobacteria bacterium]MBW2321947.1 YkgJ family cysteine cluster protein [Deltaproteobacteria bacterium]